jgi:hypothetical protein
VIEPMSMDAWMGEEIGEVPVPHSFEETAEAAFRAQDLEDRRERKRSQQLLDSQRAARQDMADMAAFMGRGRSHADVLNDFAAMSDRVDAWQAYQAERAAKRAERERQERQQERIAELEEQVAESHTRAERLGRNLREANEGWGRARDEAASFRDAHYRSYYR